MRTDTYDETKWKLVPVKPTGEMTKVGSEARWRSCVRDPDSAYEIYCAMLAVAPSIEPK